MAPNIDAKKRDSLTIAPEEIALMDESEKSANIKEGESKINRVRDLSPVRVKADAMMAKADTAIRKSLTDKKEEEIPLIDKKEVADEDKVPTKKSPKSVVDHTRRAHFDDDTDDDDTDDDDDEPEDNSAATLGVSNAPPKLRDGSRLGRRRSLDLEDISLQQQREIDMLKHSPAPKKSIRKKPEVTASGLPESIAWRVSRSWDLVADKTEKVGVDFFLRLFQEHPQAADLFRFGGDVVEQLMERDENGQMSAEVAKKIPHALRVHAKKVLDTVGVCVAGLSHLPDLIPTLRSLGKMHSSIGVQPFHYDAVYVHLLDAMEAEIGSDNFDEETRESWEIVYRSLTQVMKNPNNVLQMEPLEGWGTVATAACAYLTIVTPLQMAKLTVGNPSLEHKFNFFTVLAAIVLAMDMSSHWIAEVVRPSGVPINLSKRTTFRRQFELAIFPFKFRAIRFIRSLQMDRWVQWRRMEATVLLSFPLQYANYLINSQAHENPDAVGVHWTYAFGLLRLAAAARVFHASACAENNFLLRRRQISAHELSTMRMTKLIVTMLLCVHINSALWCLVARMEFGPGQDPEPSAFFPLADQVFSGQLSVLNSYLHTIHWAWVNLAGIGDCDSTPQTTLECMVTLFVHICGATLYTITTGNVVNILESMSEKRNEVGGDLADLGHFMQSCHVPQDIQKRIMQGYMMKKMIGDTQGLNEQGGAEMNVAPEKIEAISRLPRHLEAEISLYYRAEAIRRRDTAFAHCSHEFLVAFVGALSEPQVILSQEVYVHEGQPMPGQCALLVEGEMQVLVDGVCVRNLEAGDLIGKNQLFFAKSTDRFGLTAETTCTLMTGLSSPDVVGALQERFPRDFSLLTAYRKGHVPQGADVMSDLSWISTGSSTKRRHASMSHITS